MKQLTFSQILEPYHGYGFDTAYWCSYSLDFSTIDFLINRDFKRVMSPCSLHLMCDPHQWSKQIPTILFDQRRLSKIARMQQYCTLSFQGAVGSFHPKIILLASEQVILLLLSSANATSSGILSNQDLIASYSYSPSNSAHAYVIRSFLKYLSGFSGWNPTAREHLEKVLDRFKDLRGEPGDQSVLTIPAEKPLIDQMVDMIDDPSKVNHLNIYSPFFDDELEAVHALHNTFHCTAEVLTPSAELSTQRTNPVEEGITFRTSKNLPKSGFHAKFYELRREADSIVFWGSANCSRSGILLAERNYEFLVGARLTHEEVSDIWPDTSTADECEVVTTAAIQDEGGEIKKQLTISSVEKVGNQMQVKFTGSGFYSGCIGHMVNGDTLDLEIVQKEKSFINVATDQQILFLYLVFENERVSTYGYVNHPEQIAARIGGRTSGGNPFSEGLQAEKAIRHAFGYFNIDLTKSGVQPLVERQHQNGFWHMPRYTRTGHLSQVVDLESFIKTRVLYFNLKHDEDHIDEQNSEVPESGKKVEIHSIVWREAEKIHNNLSLLITKDRTDEIVANRWLLGFDLISTYFLEILRENPEVHTSGRMVPFLHDICTVSVWLMLRAPKEHVDYEHRAEVVLTLLDLFICSSLYDYLNIARKTRRRDVLLDLDELFLVRRAVYLKYLLGRECPELEQTSHHSHESVTDFLENLSWKQLAESIRNAWANGNLNLLPSVPPVEVYELDTFHYLYLEDDKGHSVLQGIVPGYEGKERKYSKYKFKESKQFRPIELTLQNISGE